LSLTCDRSVVFSGFSGFLHQSNWPPRNNWNIVESGAKHHQANEQILSMRYPYGSRSLFFKNLQMECIFHYIFSAMFSCIIYCFVIFVFFMNMTWLTISNQIAIHRPPFSFMPKVNQVTPYVTITKQLWILNNIKRWPKLILLYG
jgi:hypothetical protein